MKKTNSARRLKNYLQAHSEFMRKIHSQPNWKYGGFEELILDCGSEMAFTPLPKNIERGLPKNCYSNCLKLALANSKLTYCEGFALCNNDIFPYPHAWLTDSGDRAIDPTWKDGDAYIGVPLRTEWLVSFLLSRKSTDTVTVFEGNYLERFSLLKQGLPNKAFAPEFNKSI